MVTLVMVQMTTMMMILMMMMMMMMMMVMKFLHPVYGDCERLLLVINVVKNALILIILW